MSPKYATRPKAVRTPSGGGLHLNDMAQRMTPLSSDRAEKSPAHDLLSKIGVLELLEADERPTFVIDLTDPGNHGPNELIIVLANTALRSRSEMMDQVVGHDTRVDTYARFKKWATKETTGPGAGNPAGTYLTYAGVVWTSSCLHKHVRICRAYQHSSPYGPRFPPASPSLVSSNSGLNKENDNKAFDKTPSKEPQDYFGSAVAPERKNFRTQSTDKIVKARAQQKAVNLTGTQETSSSATRSRSPLRTDHNGGSQQTSAIEKAVKDFTLTSKSGTRNFDWTGKSDISDQSSHIQFIKSLDWANTALGPIDRWSPALRQAVNLIMACPYPAAMYWGEEMVQLYNEAYIALAGPKHPGLMGQRYQDGWAEIWDLIKDAIEDGYRDGKSTTRDSDLLFISRKTMLEETYFDWGLIPILAGDGSVAGLYNPAFEQTSRKVFERRMLTLQEIGTKAATLQDLKVFWKALLGGLEYNELDHPFALAYSLQDDVDSDSPASSTHSGTGGIKHCNLEGTLGISHDHPICVQTMEFQNGAEYLVQILRDATKNSDATYLSVADGTLDPKLLDGIQGRGFEDPCTALIICPIFLPNGIQPVGFLLTGVNSRRPYDDDYRLYVSLLSRQLATTVASIVLFEEEIARGKRAAKMAAKQQNALSEQLNVATQQVAESETKFGLLAAVNPAGLFIANPHGKITWNNEKFLRTMGVTAEQVKAGLWMGHVVPEDQVNLQRAWNNFIQLKASLDVEFRLNTALTHPSGGKAEAWAAAQGIMAMDDFGKLTMVAGFVNDISRQKRAEHYEKQRMEEAMAQKQTQEAFVDMTSHEMRNPLSAILQCADELAKLADEQLASGNLPSDQMKAWKHVAEVCQALTIGAQHEKRIVDDILTLSKMDAGKLKVSPEPCDPKQLAYTVQTMLTSEVKYHEMDLKVQVDSSFAALGVDWVNLDPSRVLAILLNLTTNSIKFTAKECHREITITLAASRTPGNGNGDVNFIPVERDTNDPTTEPGWGDGETVYLHYSVRDTGKGLSREEIHGLFRRFSQASDKTHVTYGGSGLGLFIARLLAELHGGQIGVASTPGQGSTFQFYVKAKKTTKSPPSQDRKKFIKPKEQVHVLLAEDNSLSGQTTVRGLKRNGCVVYMVDNGADCLDVLRQSTRWQNSTRNVEDRIQVDLILMDQEMPIVDGLQCAKEIRRLEDKGQLIGHVPIICTTANARAEQLAAVVAAGMDDAETKPFIVDDLFSKILRLLNQYPFFSHDGVA